MFKLEENKSYNMPVHFGGGNPPTPDFAVYVRDFVGLTYTCTTDGDQLANYVPEGFQLLRPEIMYGFGHLGKVDFLAGGSYNIIRADVPVRFNGTRDRLEGNYNLVTWENLTEPIIGGREQNGVPKIYADIQDLHSIPDYPPLPNVWTNASHGGNTFVRMTMSNLKPIEGEQLAAMQAAQRTANMFCWRYIPNVNQRGAALSQFVLYPSSIEISSAWEGSGAVEWIKQRIEQNPGQFNIINALAELPIREMAPVSMISGVLAMKPSQGRVIE